MGHVRNNDAMQNMTEAPRKVLQLRVTPHLTEGEAMNRNSRLIFATFYLITFLVTPNSSASDRTVTGSVDRATHIVKLQIEDVKPSANACDYHIQRFEYISALRSLLVDLGEERCFQDIYGKNKAELCWIPPRSLRVGGKLCLVIDGRRVGTLQFGSDTASLLSERCE
jgi:hypothetical protein